ncbi:hypothetical protein KDX31_16360 [Amphritea atlantica]|uniref:Uncharacterized protein n=1 Tax=Amphritea atlantica TaxID=355243 RepID=A0ABY5GTA8_9GAMM|nr:hypothetical protein KDX31_16360 [Amphritea atlantica]
MIKKILTLVIVFNCMIANASEISSSKEALLDSFIKAHEAKNYEEISRLINWEDVGKHKQKMIRVYTKNNFGREINHTEFEKADTNFLKSFNLGDKKYKSNLPVTHLMRIYFEEPTKDKKPEYSSVVYLVGEKPEGFQIAVVIKDQPSQATAEH